MMPLDGFLANDARLWRLDLALAWRPAPALDYNRWAVDNIEFGPESPFPGKYDPDRFPFFRRILEVLAPEHPSRHVTLLKSAQLGGTLLAQIFVAASIDLDPGGIMHVHPTEANATGYARTKWRPMIRQCKRLGEIFELRQSKEGGNSTLHQERKDGRGWLKLCGANSPASLSMYSVKRLVKDDLSKWESDPDAGDPEAMAESRTKAFRDAKILGIGTGLLKSNCRTTQDFLAGSQEYYHVPCPHCWHKHPLEPENFVANIDPEHPERAHFSCPECGGVIEEKHRALMVRDRIAGGEAEWVAHKPSAPDPSFYIWAAYAGLESWETIARAYLAALGDPKSEQVWWNDTAGRAYELPGEAPAWEDLKKRADLSTRRRGIVPTGHPLLTLTFDCQDEFVDGVLVAWGPDLTRAVVERIRVEGHISLPETRAALNRLVEHAWPCQLGARRRADLVGIDANAWTDDVHDWAKRWPRSRVIMVRGVAGDAAPSLALVRRERRNDGKPVKYQGRFFNVGVASLKGGLYKFLRIAQPGERGWIDFPAGLDEDYFEQLTAEKRTPRIDKRGFTVYEWRKPRGLRNEQLDVMVYGEACAIRLGWRTHSREIWQRLIAERDIAGAHADSGPATDLFTVAAAVMPSAPASDELPISGPPAGILPGAPEEAPAVTKAAPARPRESSWLRPHSGGWL